MDEKTKIINFLNKYKIKKNIYNDKNMKKYEFDGTNTIMVKAGMGMGKTKMLEPLIEEYKNKNIVIVSFRVTLDKEYARNLKGFELYSGIKEYTYDIDIYKRIVVQIDSFHKIRGKIDLLILDEFTYTAMHLITSAKHKESNYNALYEYIKDLDNKIIVMDALLDVDTVKWFHYEKRNIKYIENEYEKHDDKIVYKYNNKIGLFVKSLINELKNNKKIILPTNSKNFLKTISEKINKILPNIKCRFFDSDNSDDINLENWDMYDIVGYTPTIVAGVSYEKLHFDKCYAYFVNGTSPVEMSLQQLFRVRNIEDKEIHICVEKTDNNEYITLKHELEKNIFDKSNCLIEGALNIELSRINRTIIKDSYFYLYRNILLKNNISKNNYENRLIELLKDQGIKTVRLLKEDNDNENRDFRKEMREMSKSVKDELIEDIINSEEMDDDEYDILKDKITLTYKEKCMLKKKKFRKAYLYEDVIDKDLYKKYNGKYKQFKHINISYTLKNELIDYLKDKIQDIEDNKIDKNEKVENGIEERNGRRLLTANTYILHSNKDYEKYVIGLEILLQFGINNIFDFNNKVFEVDFKKLINYLKEKEYIIRLLFKCKEFNLNNISKDSKGNKEILKYFNSKLKTLFNIYIKEDKKGNGYTLNGLDFWNEKINPFKENEDLKMEMYIKTILNNTDFDDV